MSAFITDDCNGCEECIDHCPFEAIVVDGDVCEVDSEKCVPNCEICKDECPLEAII